MENYVSLKYLFSRAFFTITTNRDFLHLRCYTLPRKDVWKISMASCSIEKSSLSRCFLSKCVSVRLSNEKPFYLYNSIRKNNTNDYPVHRFRCNGTIIISIGSQVRTYNTVLITRTVLTSHRSVCTAGYSIYVTLLPRMHFLNPRTATYTK